MVLRALELSRVSVVLNDVPQAAELYTTSTRFKFCYTISRTEYYPSPLFSNGRLRSAQHRLISASCNRWCPASWRAQSTDVPRLSEKVPWGALVPKPATSGHTHSHIRSPPRRKFILQPATQEERRIITYLSVYLSRKNVRVNGASSVCSLLDLTGSSSHNINRTGPVGCWRRILNWNHSLWPLKNWGSS